MNEGETTNSALKDVTQTIQDGIAKGQYTLKEIQDVVVTKTKQAAETTDTYVHENPWKTIGIAAGLGFVVGLLMAPRD
jgi:ElaB/YqjD/DUF883 family membrane-anchored ribosome-binding protein